MTASRARRYTGPRFETVELVFTRADNRCERCGAEVEAWQERGLDYSIHHRSPRRMGGTKSPLVNGTANLLLLCGSGTQLCHGEVESRRAEAIEAGYLVPSGVDPATYAVLLRRERWVYLNGDGEYVDHPGRAA